MNVLPRNKQRHVISLLLEGCSIRSIERLTGVHRDTIMRLAVRAGEHCFGLMNEHIRDFRSPVLELDEAWTFVHTKDAHLKAPQEEYGSQYIFIALCRETKLIPAFMVGKRTTKATEQFIVQLFDRVLHLPMVVTDAFYGYGEALGRAVPHRMAHGVKGRDGVYTNAVERQNLTLRNFVRRMARKTICFSKKIENLKAALALHFCWYNFGRIHGSLRVTPAMAAGMAQTIWDVEELLPESN